MNSGKVSLENASAQWELYDDATGKLSKWMSDTDAGLKLETALQNTLPEKRAQCDRVKVSSIFLLKRWYYIISGITLVSILIGERSILNGYMELLSQFLWNLHAIVNGLGCYPVAVIIISR